MIVWGLLFAAQGLHLSPGFLSELGLWETLPWEEIGQQDLVGLLESSFSAGRVGQPSGSVAPTVDSMPFKLQYTLGKDVFHQMWRKGSGAFD